MLSKESTLAIPSDRLAFRVPFVCRFSMLTGASQHAYLRTPQV